MRVAYVLNTYPATSQTFIRREILALESLGATVARIALRGWDTSIADPVDADERAKTLYLLRKGTLGLVGGLVRTALRHPARLARATWAAIRMARHSERNLAYHFAYLAEACRVAELARSLRIDHLHAHFGTNAAEVVMLARLLGAPTYSFTVHGPEEFDRPIALHLREKIERSAFVVAISSFARSQLFRWLPYGAWSKVRIIHCGLDQEFHTVDPVPPPATPRVVCIGRICEQKGQLLLVEAAAALAEEGLRFELVFGGDGDMRATLEALIDERKLRGHARVTGWLSSAEVRQEILAARALVLPSFAEGLPVVLMEAMALGRPVLTTSIAAIPELVEQGREGWLVPPGDMHALKEALRHVLLQAPEGLAQMGAQARRKVLVRHSIEDSAHSLLNSFRQVNA